MRSKRILSASLLIGIILTAMLLSSGCASAVPFEIKGYVRDSNGVPVVNANIHLEVIDYNNNTLPYDIPRATNSDGYFHLSPGINEPGDCLGYSGDSVQLSATSGERSGSVQIWIPYNSTWGVWRNVTVSAPAENPLIGPVGIAAIGMPIAAIVIFVVWLSAKRKQEEISLDSKRGPKRKRRGPK